MSQAVEVLGMCIHKLLKQGKKTHNKFLEGNMHLTEGITQRKKYHIEIEEIL